MKDESTAMSFESARRLYGMTIERDLHRTFRGPVYLPGDQAYNAARATWSGALDQRPAVVAESLSARDVQAALVAAREHDLAFAVQATGHGTHTPCDGGLLLKTSLMAEVLIDPDRRVARVGPGARMGDIVAAAAPFGLAPVAGSNPTVGVAGFTLGGGFGPLARRHGFAADNLLRADVVTASGERLTATADRHADLFWALRGGGGNFGVVTALEIRLHPLERRLSATAQFDAERAADTLAFYRDWAPTQPLGLTTSIVLGGDETFAIRAHAHGEEAARALRPLFDVAGPRLGFEETVGGTAPVNFHLFRDLPEITGTTANEIEVRYWGGAMADGDAPVGHRDTPFSVTVHGADEALAAQATGGSFLNFLHDTARTHTAYAPADYARLRDLKRAYDPNNVFALGHNIAPAAEIARAA
jgi:FAD/FMN-containing dehydrogenase